LAVAFGIRVRHSLLMRKGSTTPKVDLKKRLAETTAKAAKLQEASKKMEDAVHRLEGRLHEVEARAQQVHEKIRKASSESS